LLPLPVEAHRLDRAVAELQLVVATAEAGSAPAGLEELHQALEPALAAIFVEALEDVVDEDAEALVDRRLLGNAENPRELVLQRAGQVEVEVGGREAERAVAAARQEVLQRGFVSGRDQPLAAVPLALGVEQVGVERRGVELGLLLRGGDLPQEAVDRLDRLRSRLLAGALRERRQLQQLEVAGDRPVEVDDGVQSRLTELAAGAPRRLEHL